MTYDIKERAAELWEKLPKLAQARTSPENVEDVLRALDDPENAKFLPDHVRKKTLTGRFSALIL